MAAYGKLREDSQNLYMILSENKHKILSHEGLLTKIWGYDFDGGEGVVHVNIKRLRDKLPVNIIKTIKGAGYRLRPVDDDE